MSFKRCYLFGIMHSYMNKESLQWSLIGLLFVGLITMGGLVVGQGAQIHEVARSLRILTSQEQGVSLADEYAVITQKTVAWNGGVYQFTHRCKGEVKVADQQSVPFCIGSNQLVVIDPTSVVKVLKTESVDSAADAPVLLSTHLVPGSQKGSLLISYTVDTCTTTNDCGVGMPTNYVGWVYNLSDQSLRGLSNYPEFGRPVWNTSGTKAVFIPSTCGGAGCNVAPLTGYVLGMDTVSEVTTVKAAGSENEQAQDVQGNRLAQWGSVTWNTDSSFTAAMRLEDGSTQRVSGEL